MGASGSCVDLSSQAQAGGAAHASRDFRRNFAELLILGGFQPADLLLKCSYAGDLADAGGNAEGQKVARYVEGARRDVALVRVGLHLGGARKLLPQKRERLVDERCDRLSSSRGRSLVIDGGLSRIEFGRGDECRISKNPDSGSFAPVHPTTARLLFQWQPVPKCLRNSTAVAQVGD